MLEKFFSMAQSLLRLSTDVAFGQTELAAVPE